MQPSDTQQEAFRCTPSTQSADPRITYGSTMYCPNYKHEGNATQLKVLFLPVSSRTWLFGKYNRTQLDPTYTQTSINHADCSTRQSLPNLAAATCSTRQVALIPTLSHQLPNGLAATCIQRVPLAQAKNPDTTCSTLKLKFCIHTPGAWNILVMKPALVKRLSEAAPARLPMMAKVLDRSH
jgi:hypothetical protein